MGVRWRFEKEEPMRERSVVSVRRGEEERKKKKKGRRERGGEVHGPWVVGLREKKEIKKEGKKEGKS